MCYLSTVDNLIKPVAVVVLFYKATTTNCIEGGGCMKELTDEQLQELAKKIRREYQREWRKKNPDKVSEYNKRYWRRKALEMLKESK